MGANHQKLACPRNSNNHAAPVRVRVPMQWPVRSSQVACHIDVSAWRRRRRSLRCSGSRNKSVSIHRLGKIQEVSFNVNKIYISTTFAVQALVQYASYYVCLCIYFTLLKNWPRSSCSSLAVFFIRQFARFAVHCRLEHGFESEIKRVYKRELTLCHHITRDSAT